MEQRNMPGWNRGEKARPKQKCRRPRICRVTAYVKRRVTAYVEYVTAEPLEARSRHCQGLHNSSFLPYGSSHLERSVLAFDRSFEMAANLLPPRREDECTDC